MDKKVKYETDSIQYCDACGDRLPPTKRVEGVSLVCPKCVGVLQAIKKMTDTAAAAEDNLKQEIKDNIEELEDDLSELRSHLSDLTQLVD